MKIIHILPYFYPAWAYGGTPRAVYEIARRQVRLGHQVTVLTTDALNGDQSINNFQEVVEGIKIIRLKNLSNSLVWKFRFPTPFKIGGYHFESFEVIHIHETRNLLTLLALQQNIKIFFSPWGTFPNNNQQILIKKIFDIFLMKKLKSKTLLSIAQNNHELKLLSKNGVGRIQKLLPLGIDFDFFKNRPSKKVLRKKLGVAEDKKVYLFLGRFAKAKGIELLIKSFLKSQAFREKDKLFLVGRDDGYLEEMRRLIKDINAEKQIIILGPLYDKDRLLAYASADYFIFTPSIYEETATVCLEALACGLPVIVTKQAGIPYMNTADGVIQIESKEKEIISAINQVKIKKPRVNRIKLKKYFDWNGVVKKLDDIYRLR